MNYHIVVPGPLTILTLYRTSSQWTKIAESFPFFITSEHRSPRLTVSCISKLQNDTRDKKVVPHGLHLKVVSNNSSSQILKAKPKTLRI